MKFFVGKATSSVKIMKFSIGDIDMSMSFKLQKFLYLLTTIKLYTSMKRQPIFNKLILQDVFNCHYMQPTQIRIELFLRTTCRHLFYYGGLPVDFYIVCYSPIKSSVVRKGEEDLNKQTFSAVLRKQSGEKKNEKELVFQHYFC